MSPPTLPGIEMFQQLRHILLQELLPYHKVSRQTACTQSVEAHNKQAGQARCQVCACCPSRDVTTRKAGGPKLRVGALLAVNRPTWVEPTELNLPAVWGGHTGRHWGEMHQLEPDAGRSALWADSR